MELKTATGLFVVAVMVLSTTSWGDPISPKILQNLGQINGKFFFYDNQTFVSRAGAKALCEASQLRLAEIATVEELQFLASKNSTYFQGNFWTAGVDVQTRAQFKWENTSRAIASTLPFSGFDGPNTCLFYYLSATKSYLGAISCLTPATIIRALCEAV